MATALLAQESGARQLFQRAGEVLGLDLTELCTTGSDDALTRTDIAQPALLTTCVAWFEALRERGVTPGLVAGHSLGEFSAWVAAGVLEFEEALRLVRRRGELMEEAGDRRPGGMVAVIGLQDAQVSEICKKVAPAGAIVVANHNCPGQVVVSGESAALDRLLAEVKAARGRAIPLRVAGAFHSPLMEDAARAFGDLVARLPLAAPRVPVIVNATAEPVTDADQARQAMARQMTSPVLWTASVRRMMADGAEVFVEVGPGQVLTKLIERISSDVRVLPAGTPDELAAVVKALTK
jgi:[acyl-carrier-protein] S-malonyltransferase